MSKSWTGERLETFIFNENTVEHLHRYAVALFFCKDARVLDIASGEGYGSSLMSKLAASVVGVDISKETIEQAVQKYTSPNLSFKVGSAAEIPLETASVDVVVSFETIEHHDKHEEMLREIKRVMREGGVLIMSSPDKKYYTDERKYVNPFHVKELYFDEFKILIKSHFRYSTFFYQKMVAGSLLLQENTSTGFTEYSGDYNNIVSDNEFSALYNVCIASDRELPSIDSSLFDGKQIQQHALSIAIQNAVVEAVQSTEKKYESSWTFKIGKILLLPLRIFNKK